VTSDRVPKHELVIDIARRLQTRFGLTLFGFDLIVEAKTGRVFVVDINYFPSFVDVPGREVLILKAVRHACAKGS
jgi:hypothetical protein